jgi:hypothetical protein
VIVPPVMRAVIPSVPPPSEAEGADMLVEAANAFAAVTVPPACAFWFA